MDFAIVGMNHMTAPLELREKVATRGVALMDHLSANRFVPTPLIREFVMVSTCNRFEIYVASDDTLGLPDALRELLGMDKREWDGLQPFTYVCKQERAADHLFRVACGLESMVLGESQILGQIVDSYERARTKGTVGPLLSRLFLDAITVGKKIRSVTPIGEKPVSSASAMARILREIHPDLQDKRIAIVGAGSMGRSAARYLHDTGVRQLTIINRSAEKAELLAREVDGNTLPWTDLHYGLREADIAVVATTAPGYIVSLEDVQAVMARRKRRSLTLVDLSVPRNIPPETARQPEVILLDMDSLHGQVEESEAARRETIPQVEAILADYLKAFMRWKAGREVAPTIAELFATAESVRQREIGRARRRLTGLSEPELLAVEELTQSIINKILQEPVRHLKAAAENGQATAYQTAVRDLFSLEGRSNLAEDYSGVSREESEE